MKKDIATTPRIAELAQGFRNLWNDEKAHADLDDFEYYLIEACNTIEREARQSN